MAGYSGTPLVKMLGIKEDFRCYAFQPLDDYAKLLGALPPNSKFVSRCQPRLNFIHAFFENSKSLRSTFPRLKAALDPAGTLWISWRKGKVSDLGENAIRDLALASGLVDVKVCAVDETWSGLKLVYRLRDRPE